MWSNEARAKGMVVMLGVVWGVGLRGMEERMPEYELAPYPVRAWHFDGLDMNYPGDVVVVDRERIGGSPGMDLPELLASEANVRVESYNGKSGQGQVALGGFGENSGLRVLVEVDGQRMNRADMGGVNWQLVPLEDVETVEVIRGGQNVLYGNHALAGVIRITTRRGGPIRTTARLEGGSDGYRRGVVDHAGGSGDWYWDLAVEEREDDGYRDDSLTENRSFRGTVGMRTGADAGSTVAVNLAFTDGYARFPGPLLYEEYRDDPRQSASGGEEATAYRTGMAGLVWEGRHDWGRSQVNASVTVRDLDWTLGGNFAGSEQTGASLSPRFRWGGGEDFVMAGVDLREDRIEFHDYLDDERLWERSQADLKRLTVGPYVFGQRGVGADWLLSGGIRLEGAESHYRNRVKVENQILPVVETNRGRFPNPHYREVPELDPEKSYNEHVGKSGLAAEFSVLWRPGDSFRLWAGYDRVYRYPVLEETAAYQGFELAEPVNRGLEPETGHQVDLGMKVRRERFSLTASLFYMRLDGEIVYDDELNLNVNLADTRRLGGEMGLRWEGETVSASTRVSVVQARFSDGPYDGKEVPLVPWAHGVSSLRYRPWPMVEVALYHHWSSDRYQGNDYTNKLRKVDSFQRVDLRLSVGRESVTAFIALKNLFDTTYAPLAYRGAWYPAPGRQWRAGWKVTF